MPQLYYDALLCSAFVIVLVSVLTVGRSAFETCKDAYRQIVYGLAFLTVFSFIHLAINTGLPAHLTFLKDKQFAKIVEATFIAGGLIFLLIGLGSWLPTIRDKKVADGKSQRRYNCLSEITRMINNAESFDDAVNGTLTSLTEQIGINRTAGFKYAAKLDALFLIGTHGFSSENPPVLNRIDLTGTDLHNILVTSRYSRDVGGNTIFDNGRQPDIVIPIRWQERLYGSLLCWQGEKEIDEETIELIALAGDMLGHKAGSLVQTQNLQYQQQQNDAYSRLSRLCNQVSSLQQLTKPLFDLLQDALGAEFMTIAEIDGSGENMFRYSINAGGRVLLEKRVSRPTQGTDMEKVFKDNHTIIVDDVQKYDRYHNEDGLIISCGMHAKIVSPVAIGRRVLATVVLGHSQPGYFSRLHQRRLEELIHLVASVIDKERLHESVETREEQMIRLQMMEKDLLSEKPIDEIFTEACDMLTKRMKCTMARVSLIDKENENLITQKWQTIRDTGQKVNQSEKIPLTLLPWHRLAVENSKPMLINQADMDSRMQAQESTQTLLPNIKSAMLVPIQLNGSVRGIISIGEVRNWNRRTFSAADLILAKDVAGKCSLALRMKQLRMNKLNSRPFANMWRESSQEPIRALRSELKSPLTSIIGAVELLKTKEGAEDEFATRYYNMIMRSAEKIQTLTEKEDWGRSEDKTAPEQVLEPEQVIG
ncbi:MAG: GAF domain-containing protein [Candidatus Zixiibacteriota bacterium]